MHESIIGSLFRGRVEAEAMVGDKKGIIPSIELGEDYRLQHDLD